MEEGSGKKSSDAEFGSFPLSPVSVRLFPLAIMSAKDRLCLSEVNFPLQPLVHLDKYGSLFL